MPDIEPQTASGKVLLHFLISLDGFVAGPGHSMDWMAGITNQAGLVDEYVETTGAVLAGRDGFDAAIDDARPYGGRWKRPIFVVTHHPEDARPAADVTFLDCPVEEAVRIGLEAAGARTSRCSHPPSESSSSTAAWSTRSTSTWHRCCSATHPSLRHPGGDPVRLTRVGTEPTLTASVRHRPPAAPEHQ